MLRNIPLRPADAYFLIAKQDRQTMKKVKVHSLTGRIDSRMMHEAFRAVKRNRGAAGVDKVSVEMFADNLEENRVKTTCAPARRH